MVGGALVKRNTRTRDIHRRIIAIGFPPCALCGEDIDYSLTYPDARSYVVDHRTPLAQGGADTIDNKQPAHRDCNRAKGDRLDGGPIIRRSGALKDPRGRTPLQP